MSSDQVPTSSQPKAGQPMDSASASALRTTRRLWLAMLAALVTTSVLATAAVTTRAIMFPIAHRLALLSISYLLALALCVAGYFLRMQTYKRCWVGHRITAHGYYAGNVIVYGLIYLAALVAMTNMVLTGRLVPEMMPAVVCLILLGVNYPNGRPMQRTGDG